MERTSFWEVRRADLRQDMRRLLQVHGAERVLDEFRLTTNAYAKRNRDGIGANFWRPLSNRLAEAQEDLGWLSINSKKKDRS